MKNVDEDTLRGVVHADHPMHAELRMRLDKTLGEGFALMLARYGQVRISKIRTHAIPVKTSA
jgi:hypothetical protein